MLSARRVQFGNDHAFITTSVCTLYQLPTLTPVSAVHCMRSWLRTVGDRLPVSAVRRHLDVANRKLLVAIMQQDTAPTDDSAYHWQRGRAHASHDAMNNAAVPAPHAFVACACASGTPTISRASSGVAGSRPISRHNATNASISWPLVVAREPSGR